MATYAVNFQFVNARGEFFIMFGRCFSRPRPMCGMAPMPAPMPAMPIQPAGCGLPRPPVIPLGGGCQVTQSPQPRVVVEPAIVAAPNIFHHHQDVAHIQPVITQDVHYCHSHHKYIVQEQKRADEVINKAHGLCGPAMTRPATPCFPCR